MKVVKVIYKNHKISTGNLYPVKVEYFHYNSESTFKELFISLNIDNAILDEKGTFYSLNGNILIKYIVHDGRVDWLVPVKDCTIEDYLNTYNLKEIVLFVANGIGGISFPEIDWQALLEVLEQGKSFFGFILNIYEIKNICQELKEKYIKYKRGLVPLYIVEDFIKSKDYWALSEVKMRLNLELDESVKVLLELAGYLYDEKTDLYYFNKTLSQKNHKKFKDFVNKYLETHDVNEIVKEG